MNFQHQALVKQIHTRSNKGGIQMFKARTADGRNNISGLRVKELRKALQISQRELSDRLQVVGLDIDKNAVQRIESGERFVTDIEIIALSKCFNVTVNNLLGIK